jgi:DNA anti-recombination protein RmuC
MAVDERRRSQLYEQLSGAVGEEAAGTMFELLPPPQTDLATTADLERLERKMDHRFELVDQRFEQVDQRIEHLEQRFDQRFEQLERRFDERFGHIDERFGHIDERFGHVDDRFTTLQRELEVRLDGVRDELLAAFRGELVTAVSGQTRAMLVAVITTVAAVGGLAVALTQVLVP